MCRCTWWWGQPTCGQIYSGTLPQRCSTGSWRGGGAGCRCWKGRMHQCAWAHSNAHSCASSNLFRSILFRNKNPYTRLGYLFFSPDLAFSHHLFLRHFSLLSPFQCYRQCRLRVFLARRMLFWFRYLREYKNDSLLLDVPRSASMLSATSTPMDVRGAS